MSHHSGATARDFHPLPYSPHYWGTQMLSNTKNFQIDADGIMRSMGVSNIVRLPSTHGVLSTVDVCGYAGITTIHTETSRDLEGWI